MLNISQGIIAAIEGYIITGKMDQALLYGGSTLVATAVGGYVPNLPMLGNSAVAEKQLQEPLAAAVLAMVGQWAFGVKGEGHDAKHKYLKVGAKSFIITGSSAGLNEVIATKAIGGNSYAQAREVLAAKRVAAPQANNYRVESTIVA